MEGLAIHREGGEIVLSMISDDNFSSLQRTLLLEFRLRVRRRLEPPCLSNKTYRLGLTKLMTAHIALMTVPSNKLSIYTSIPLNT